MKTVRYGSRNLSLLITRNQSCRRQVSEKVQRILADVKLNGDQAVLRYTRKFDKAKLSAKEIRVSEDEINACFQNIEPEFVSALKVAIENVTKYYSNHKTKSNRVVREDGAMLCERTRPLETVGVYVPAGTVPHISSVYMTVIPAYASGVQNVYLFTPPQKNKTIDSHILAAANLLKVKGIYKVGGAQAVAAMAFGTKTIPKVDKIVGPGNMYVAEAKRQVFGFCDIDMVAGPTELVILANHHADPAYVAADMMAQGEHARGLSILITTSKRLMRNIRKVPARGFIVKVDNLSQGIELTNQIAPEHVQLMMKRPERIVKHIKNAGAIFLGPYTPAAIGDYVAGPSHVLPTNGSARFFSALSTHDFQKRSHVISYSKKALERVHQAAEYLAVLEGLKKHQESIQLRFKS